MVLPLTAFPLTFPITPAQASLMVFFVTEVEFPVSSASGLGTFTIDVNSRTGAVKDVVQRGRVVVAAEIDAIQLENTRRWAGGDFVAGDIVIVGGLGSIGNNHNRTLRIAHSVRVDGEMTGSLCRLNRKGVFPSR